MGHTMAKSTGLKQMRHSTVLPWPAGSALEVSATELAGLAKDPGWPLPAFRSCTYI